MNYTFKKEDGSLALVKCPNCLKENYALNVLTGICTWCGYDVNKNKEII